MTNIYEWLGSWLDGEWLGLSLRVNGWLGGWACECRWVGCWLVESVCVSVGGWVVGWVVSWVGGWLGLRVCVGGCRGGRTFVMRFLIATFVKFLGTLVLALPSQRSINTIFTCKYDDYFDIICNYRDYFLCLWII